MPQEKYQWDKEMKKVMQAGKINFHFRESLCPRQQLNQRLNIPGKITTNAQEILGPAGKSDNKQQETW